MLHRTRTYIPTSPRHWRRLPRIAAIAPFALAAGVALALTPGSAALSDDDPKSLAPGIQSVSTPTLMRSYLVYTACAVPPLIDHAPALLDVLTHSPVPGLKQITEAIVRRTFFAQFVAGESVSDCVPAILDLRKRGIGCALNYSAEADLSAGEIKESEKRAWEKARFEEVQRAIEELGQFERDIEATGGQRGSTTFALKITGLVDPDVLQRASTTLLRLRPLTQSIAPSSPQSAPALPVPYPGAPLISDARVVARIDTDPTPLPSLGGSVDTLGVLAKDQGVRPEDLVELHEVWGKLRLLGKSARENRVKLMVDAEHTCYQPALDAFTLLLSMEFNRPEPGTPFKGPVIFGTYQSYLRRQPLFLLHAIRHAEENGYALGVKLVRGAYHVQERAKWRAEARPGVDPIWPDKEATDLSFNTSLSTIITTLARQLSSPRPELALSVIFGTHNTQSVELVIESLQKNGLASPVPSDKNSDSAAPVLRLRNDVRGKVYVAQLYGMRDDLTDRVASAFEHDGLPVALKYIAYGNLAEVIPFLGRRAIENKSLMTGTEGAGAERKRIGAELWRRVWGGA